MSTPNVPHSESFCETLEDRIAPATFTYSDVDGDFVTMKTSKGTDAELQAIVMPYLNQEGLGVQVEKIDFSLAAETFAGTTLTITAKRTSAGGDGFVNIGYIDASAEGGGTALDLGAIKIAGDLGRISAGDNDFSAQGVKSLEVQSIGVFGTSTQETMTGNLNSVFVGGIGKLTVKSDIKDAAITSVGKTGAITIEGSLVGGATTNAGSIIVAGGDAGAIKINGDIEGGTGDSSGKIVIASKATSITIGGDVYGGTGANSGGFTVTGSAGAVSVGGSVLGGTGVSSANLIAGEMSSLKIGGNLQGIATSSGKIIATGAVGSISIIGSVLGGASDSGGIVISGAVNSLSIGQDVEGGSGGTSGTVTVAGDLKSATIGGSILGGDGAGSGTLLAAGTGKLTVGHDVKGGDGDDSGTVSFVNLTSVTIGGSLLGGGGESSGEVQGGTIGTVKITGELAGGAGVLSGRLDSSGTLGAVTIGNGLSAGAGSESGSILSAGNMGAVKITGGITGGSASGTADMFKAGSIISGGAISSVTVSGNILAGTDATSGSFSNNGVIRAETSIGAIDVKGSLIGNVTNDVLISAAGQASLPTTGTDLAIGKITIGKRVDHARILAGYNTVGTGLDGDGGVNADAQIGPVTVSGDWQASSLAAGTTTGADDVWGTADDAQLSGMGVKDSGLLSRIASITIKGQILGSVSGMGNFGFVSQTFGTFKTGSTTVPIPAGPADETVDVGATDNIVIREVPLIGV